MVRRLQQASATQPTNNGNQTGATEKQPPERPAVFDEVERLLQAGKAKLALDLLVRGKDHSGWATNATGVCLLRLGRADRAVELYRNLLLSGSLIVRPDAPTAWKVNFATALLLVDNLSGCAQMLAEIEEEDHPGVQRLRAALQSWRNGLSVWEKIRWFLGGQPVRRVELDFLPGEL